MHVSVRGCQLLRRKNVSVSRHISRVVAKTSCDGESLGASQTSSTQFSVSTLLMLNTLVLFTPEIDPLTLNPSHWLEPLRISVFLKPKRRSFQLNLGTQLLKIYPWNLTEIFVCKNYCVSKSSKSPLIKKLCPIYRSVYVSRVLWKCALVPLGPIGFIVFDAFRLVRMFWIWSLRRSIFVVASFDLLTCEWTLHLWSISWKIRKMFSWFSVSEQFKKT